MRWSSSPTEDAVAHFERALALLAPIEGNAAERSELLLDLGGAMVRAGDHARALGLYRQAGELARSVGAAETFARSGVDGSLVSSPGFGDETNVDLFQQALAGLGEANTPFRVTVMSRMALALVRKDRGLSQSLSDAAVATARQLGSARLLAQALVARLLAGWGPESSEALASDRAEIVRIGRETSHLEVAMEGYTSSSAVWWSSANGSRSTRISRISPAPRRSCGSLETSSG